MCSVRRVNNTCQPDSRGISPINTAASRRLLASKTSLQSAKFHPKPLGGAASSAAVNAAALRALLLGAEGAYRDAVLFNAAGALIVAERASDWREGVEEAAEAIDRGLANTLLDCWVAYR